MVFTGGDAPAPAAADVAAVPADWPEAASASCLRSESLEADMATG